MAWGKLATQEFDAFGMSFPYVTAGDALNLYFRSANTPTPNRMNWKDKETDELLDKGIDRRPTTPTRAAAYAGGAGEGARRLRLDPALSTSRCSSWPAPS